MMRGFLLGLANGTVCLAYCAPVIVPYLLGEGQSVKRNYLELAQFLIGRLLGYLIFAVLAWLLGILVKEHQAFRETIFGASYILLSGLLIYYCFRKPKSLCAVEYCKGLMPVLISGRHYFLPLVLGFLTGLNLCPPFLLAFTNAVSVGSFWNSIAFFGAFFLGTSVFFVPVPILGLLKRNEVLRNIGKMAAGVIGIYYFCMGIFILIGGIKQL
jgi:sulfite exporter TauE/SafE